MAILTDSFDTSVTDIGSTGAAITQLFIGDKVLKADISDVITKKDPDRAPFVRFLEVLGNKEKAQNWKFECLEEDRKATAGTIEDSGTNVVGSASEKTLVVDEDNLFVAGDILMFIDVSAGTYERVLVDSKTDKNTYEVTRGYSDTSGIATLADTDEVVKIGSVYAENSGASDPDKIEPSWFYNLTQNFKESVEISGRMLAMAGRGQFNELQTQVRSRFRHFNESMEGAYLLGGRKYNEQGSATGKTTTGGFLWLISNWASGNVASAVNETFNQQYFDTNGNDWFRFGSKKKLALVSGKTMSKVGDFASTYLRINKKASDLLGVEVTDLATVHGILSFIHSRTLEQSAVFEKYMFIIDPMFVKKRFLEDRDTTIKTNVQANDADGKKHSIEADVGLELRNPYAHFIVTNIDNTI